jgi:hypothetical protein
MALPNIDLSKLSKLRQRLVAPSLFSTQYLFPGNQAFFRDFIICCDFHMMFIEQLKIALISELLQMNDSSMETLCITHGNINNNTAASTTNDDDADNKEKNFQQEYIVSSCCIILFLFFLSLVVFFLNVNLPSSSISPSLSIIYTSVCSFLLSCAIDKFLHHFNFLSSPAFIIIIIRVVHECGMNNIEDYITYTMWRMYKMYIYGIWSGW